MTDYELVTAFAEMIKRKSELQAPELKWAGAFGRMTGELDAMCYKIPGVREYLKQQLDERANETE